LTCKEANLREFIYTIDKNIEMLGSKEKKFIELKYGKKLPVLEIYRQTCDQFNLEQASYYNSIRNKIVENIAHWMNLINSILFYLSVVCDKTNIKEYKNLSCCTKHNNSKKEEKNMNKFMEQRIYDTAEYILKTKCTVRQAAKEVNSSKSTVYKDMSERLVQLDPKLAGEIRDIF
jgi:putative DeoR family transcriptional regulator (stage III sporulation protein D)